MKYIRFLTILLALSCGFTPIINAMKKKSTKKKRVRKKRNNNKQSPNRPLIAEKKFIPNIDLLLPKNANDSERLKKAQLWLNATSFQSRVIRQLSIFAEIIPILRETQLYAMTNDKKFIKFILSSSGYKKIAIKDNVNGDERICEVSMDGKQGFALKIFTPEGIVNTLFFHPLVKDQFALTNEVKVPGFSIRKTNLRHDKRLKQLYKKFRSAQGEIKHGMGWMLHTFYSAEFFSLIKELPMGIFIWHALKTKPRLFDYIAQKENVEFLKSLPCFEKTCDIMKRLFLAYMNNGYEDEYDLFVTDEMYNVANVIPKFLDNVDRDEKTLQNTYSHVHTHLNRLITISKILDKRIIRAYKKMLPRFFNETCKPVPESIIFHSEQPVQKNSTVVTNVAKKRVVQQQKKRPKKKSSLKNEKQVSNNNVNVKEEISVPDEGISAEHCDYETRITYDERVFRWYDENFARARLLEDYYHHCFSPLVAQYIIKYGKHQQWKNRRYKNQKDDHYSILGEREYTVENKKEFVVFNCCLDPKGTLYHQEANMKEFEVFLDEYSKDYYWKKIQFPTIQEVEQMKKQAKSYSVSYTEDEFGSKVIEENDYCIKIWDNTLEMKITLYKLPYAQS